MPSRRLDEHIRDLCAKVVNARDIELEAAIAQLNSALREHSIRLRKMAAEKLTGAEPPTIRSPQVLNQQHKC